MLGRLVKKIIGSRNDRLLKKKKKLVKKINALEPQFRALDDQALAAKTQEFRDRLNAGTTLDPLLPEAFAAVREAAWRALGMRHFDVQLIGGMVLHDGKIAEMKTGEGKTLVATLAAYFNALSGNGVHVVTVNDYLARRDSNWMGKVYGFLGMSTGCIIGGLSQAERRESYAADITYGTNNEFGFDYLRDNMAFSLAEKVQRGHAYAIVDEVDSILIDEARTPLIISGPAEGRTELYQQINELIPPLVKQEKEGEPGDYSLDEKSRQAFLTEAGHETMERMMVRHGLIQAGESLYEIKNIRLMHYVNACLRANVLFQRDVDYLVRDNMVIIVDEFTGRAMLGRRWSDGLHQAMEAKERVPVQNENQTLASITFQNYFRMYRKLSGMTGTADTEAAEFSQIYGLEVVIIPPNRPMCRKDMGDLVYLTVLEKYAAIVEDIKYCVNREQPVLVGTASIENSEYLSRWLQKDGIAHQVLNAKQHEREAHIIAGAGKPGTVTIATNMAGRGTDIVLGGSWSEAFAAYGESDPVTAEQIKHEWQQRHEQVVAAGGLHVIGSERHESRRIDNQLRGRSGRQGDPGSTRFYLSLEDNLMRIFASDKVASLMQKLGMGAGEAIEHPWVTRAIENAQRKVEARNFDIRKSLLEFDDVANDQRRVIYQQRDELMEADDISDVIEAVRYDVVDALSSRYIPPQSMEEQWNLTGLEEALERELNLSLPMRDIVHQHPDWHEQTIREYIAEQLNARSQAKTAALGESAMRHFEKSAMLQVLDNTWKEHLGSMDYLRQGIHLRGYAQRDPKQEYKKEAFQLFNTVLEDIKQETIGILCKAQVRTEADVEALDEQLQQLPPAQMHYEHAEAVSVLAAEPALEAPPPMQAKVIPIARPFVRDTEKVGRNEPCPCGSGKKYKTCHGKLA